MFVRLCLFQNNYQLIAANLSEQKELGVNPRAI